MLPYAHQRFSVEPAVVEQLSLDHLLACDRGIRVDGFS